MSPKTSLNLHKSASMSKDNVSMLSQIFLFRFFKTLLGPTSTKRLAPNLRALFIDFTYCTGFVTCKERFLIISS